MMLCLMLNETLALLYKGNPETVKNFIPATPPNYQMLRQGLFDHQGWFITFNRFNFWVCWHL